MKNKVTEELKQHFRPEFLNRVDEIIVFPPLTKDQIISMVDNMIASVELRMKDRDMSLELTQAAKDLLADARLRPGARVPGRCVARSSARSRTCSPRRCSTARSAPARSCSSTSRARAPTAHVHLPGQQQGRASRRCRRSSTVGGPDDSDGPVDVPKAD